MRSLRERGNGRSWVFNSLLRAISARLPGRGTVHIMRSGAFADVYGYARHSGMQAITVSFKDLGNTLALFKSRGVTVAHSRYGQWIEPRDANGFIMHLAEDNRHS